MNPRERELFTGPEGAEIGSKELKESIEGFAGQAMNQEKGILKRPGRGKLAGRLAMALMLVSSLALGTAACEGKGEKAGQDQQKEQVEGEEENAAAAWLTQEYEEVDSWSERTKHNFQKTIENIGAWRNQIPPEEKERWRQAVRKEASSLIQAEQKEIFLENDSGPQELQEQASEEELKETLRQLKVYGYVAADVDGDRNLTDEEVERFVEEKIGEAGLAAIDELMGNDMNEEATEKEETDREKEKKKEELRKRQEEGGVVQGVSVDPREF